MNSFNRAIDRFCYRHPRFGIRNLMKYLVVLNVAVYILYLVEKNTPGSNGALMSYFYFSPHLILQGQVWRLVTFVFIPTEENLFFFAIMQYFYYFIGTRLEAEWGSGRFTIYYLLSVLITAVFGVVAYVFTKSPFLVFVNSSYINMSLFFAFATMYPDARVMLFFFIPIKVKWLAIVGGLYYLYGIITSFDLFPLNLLPLVALLTYLLFFGSTLMTRLTRIGRNGMSRYKSRPQKQKPVNFKKAQRNANRQAKKAKRTMGTEGKSAPHTRKCAVCGRTDAEFPNLEFRFCSQCSGYHCFCSEHINNHVHFTE